MPVTLSITVQPMWEDGSIGGEDDPFLPPSAPFDTHEHAAIGAFIAARAEAWIGRADPADGALCDALDITITRR